MMVMSAVLHYANNLGTQTWCVIDSSSLAGCRIRCNSRSGRASDSNSRTLHAAPRLQLQTRHLGFLSRVCRCPCVVCVLCVVCIMCVVCCVACCVACCVVCCVVCGVCVCVCVGGASVHVPRLNNARESTSSLKIASLEQYSTSRSQSPTSETESKQ